MAKVDENVRIYGGLNDTLWLAAKGSTLPTTFATPASPFEDVGYFGESGIDKSRDESVSKFRAHQGGKVVATKVTESGMTIVFRTIEENGVTTALGETIVGTPVVATGVKTTTFASTSEVKERAGVLDLWSSATRVERYVFPLLQITGGGNVTWSKDNLTEREFTAEVIGNFMKIEADPEA